MVGEARSPVTIILLGIVTCGIYLYMWVYKVSDETRQNLGDESIEPGKIILFTILSCGLYLIYWYYQMGSHIQRLYEKKGLTAEDETTLLLILGVAFPLGAIYIIQDRLNKLYE